MRIAIVGVLLSAAACTASTGTGSPAPTGSGTGQPSSTGATGVPTTSGPAQPTAPPLTAVPVRAVPACARVTCSAAAVLANVRPGIHLVLVRGPDIDGVQQTAYLLTLDATGTALESRKLAYGDVFFDAELPKPTCDQLVHCFVPAGTGAHGGVMDVLGVGPAGQLTDISQAGEVSTDTPNLRARDLDGDGTAEVLGVQNNYQPNYAEGTEYWVVWAWRGGRYVLTGCRKVRRGEEAPSGPVSPSSCPS